jgi:hypothetical protein
MSEDELRRWWNTPEHQRVVEVISDAEVARLANFDGCICSRFSVRNVDIEIGCGKGGKRGVFISSPSLDYWDGESADDCDPELLRPIAEEIVRQLAGGDWDGRGPLPIFYNEQR